MRALWGAVAHRRAASGGRRPGSGARGAPLRSPQPAGAGGECARGRLGGRDRGSRDSLARPDRRRPAGSLDPAACGGAASAAARRRIRPGPGRRPRSGRRQAGARDRRGGRAQPADDRPARSGQDDARAAAAGRAAAAELRRGAGDHAGPQRGGHRRRAARRRATVSRAAPHHLALRDWSAAGRARGRASSRSRTAASCSSTSCRSSAAPRSTLCASRSRTGG